MVCRHVRIIENGASGRQIRFVQGKFVGDPGRLHGDGSVWPSIHIPCSRIGERATVMKCPACENELAEVTAEPVVVDVCQGGCGGVWFDAHEFRKVDEAHEAAGESILDIPRNPGLTIDRTLDRQCPRCDSLMVKHFVSTKHEVEVDECYKCGGLWLDAGELAGIRTQFETDADRQAAAKQYFGEVFEDKIASLKAKGDKDAARAERLARVFRFICPSYYIAKLKGEPWQCGSSKAE